MSFLSPSPTANAPLKNKLILMSFFLPHSPTSSGPLKINDHKGNKMGRRGREPSAFPVLFKMSAMLEEDWNHPPPNHSTPPPIS